MHTTSIFIPFAHGEQLHMRRFCTDEAHPALLLIPGSIEDGKIFYSDSGKGFAPWMAQNGFDVFVPDLRGRGLSTPKISGASNFGQEEALKEEYPAYFAKISEIKGEKRVFLGAHSWGGVNLLTFLARPFAEIDVPAMVFFGSKRHISVRGLRYYYMIGLGWELMARRIIRRKGFLDAVNSNMGSDNISARDWAETNAWVRAKNEWRNWHDGFDYRKALSKIQLPPVLYFAGKRDYVLGNPIDVQLLADETGTHQVKKVELLAKSNGHLQDYGHIDMLTHPDAPRDHFPMALEWLRKYN
jgi:pimeloyl-ACP methyl ester carboxylesterase